MSYFLTYNMGFRQPSGKKAQLGTVVHKVMEVLAKLKKQIQDKPKSKSLKIEDDAIGNFSCTSKSLFTKSLIDKLLNASYNHYTSNCIHTYNNSDMKFCKDLVDAAIEYNNGQFDPRYSNIVEAEPHFDIPIEEEWAKYEFTDKNGNLIKGQLAIKGTIDLVTEVDDGIIEVVDYKTGRRLNWATGEEKTYDKLCKDPQLLLYNYAISKLFPNYKQAIMSIFYVRDGGPFSMCFDSKDQKMFLDMLQKRFKQIQRNNFPQPVSPERNSFKCTKLCHFYKTKWPGTNETMCHYVENHLKAFGYEETVDKLADPNFDIGYYEAPG